MLTGSAGLPYWEPSFATISRVQAEGSPGTNGSATDSRDGAQPITGPAGADILLSGTANGHTLNGSCPPRQAAGTQGGALGAARRALLALGSFALGKQTLPPVAPRQFVTKGEGRAAVHGVVHQITTANMAQVQACLLSPSSFPILPLIVHVPVAELEPPGIGWNYTPSCRCWRFGGACAGTLGAVVLHCVAPGCRYGPPKGEGGTTTWVTRWRTWSARCTTGRW